MTLLQPCPSPPCGIGGGPGCYPPPCIDIWHWWAAATLLFGAAWLINKYLRNES